MRTHERSWPAGIRRAAHPGLLTSFVQSQYPPELGFHVQVQPSFFRSSMVLAGGPATGRAGVVGRPVGLRHPTGRLVTVRGPRTQEQGR